MASFSRAKAVDAAKVALTRYPALYNAMRRPYAIGRFMLRRPHDRDYEVFGLFPERTGLFLDVGANAGMSALSFRIYNRVSKILAVEPNPFHEADLRFTMRLAKPFEYLMWAAGSEDGTMTLHVPLYRKVPLTTEASLRAERVTRSPHLRRRLGAGMQTGDFEMESRTVPVRRLDVLQLDPSFIKLDVQGFEYEALLGLERTVRRSKPILLVEGPGDKVRGFLADLGYEAFQYLPDSRKIVSDKKTSPNILFLAPQDAALFAAAPISGAV
jgi:FkbM family methyltransferase